jgi:amino acid transporter
LAPYRSAVVDAQRGRQGGSSDETNEERLDRELIELLNELRVALPGVQVLFAFLLTVPFSQRFETLSSGTTDVYFAAVICSALASILLIAPAAHHRLRFRGHDKEQLLRFANVMALAGLFMLALALGAAAYIVADAIYGIGRARLVAGFLAGGAAFFWFVLPMLYARGDRRPNPSD